jgi:hypothetical protein
MLHLSGESSVPNRTNAMRVRASLPVESPTADPRYRSEAIGGPAGVGG